MKALRFIFILGLTLMMCVAVYAAYILFTTRGADSVIRFVVKSAWGMEHVVFERLEGSLTGGVQIFNVEASRFIFLPESGVIRVQELDVRLAAPSWEGLEARVINARLITPQADNIVINAALRAGQYAANAYSKSLDLAWLTAIIRRFNNLPLIHGDLRNIDLVISGSAFEPVVKGALEVGHIPLNGFLLYDTPVACDLSFKRRGTIWETYGKLSAQQGWLKSPKCLVELGESRLVFSGDILDPEIDIHAAAVIARTRIDIVVRGKRKDPKITLTSDPPLPQEQLLLMLTTGRRWDGIDMAVTTRKMTPELAGDFVDYFFFGGSGERIARMFGLSGVSYKLDSTVQGVTLNKNLTEKLDVGYGIEIGTAGDQHQRELTQTVESEYRLNSHVIIAAQKEILSSGPLSMDTDLRRVPDDRVFLKYRKEF